MPHALKTFATWSTVAAMLAMAVFVLLTQTWGWNATIVIWICTVTPLFVAFVILWLEYFRSPMPCGNDERTREMELAQQKRLVRSCSMAGVLAAVITGFLHVPGAIVAFALVLLLLYVYSLIKAHAHIPFRWSLPVFLLLPTVIATIFSNGVYAGSMSLRSLGWLVAAGVVTWLIGHVVHEYEKHQRKGAKREGVKRTEMFRPRRGF